MDANTICAIAAMAMFTTARQTGDGTGIPGFGGHRELLLFLRFLELVLTLANLQVILRGRVARLIRTMTLVLAITSTAVAMGGDATALQCCFCALSPGLAAFEAKQNMRNTVSRCR